MPEMLFFLRWPDASESENYSPSSVIRDYFTPGEAYAVAEFMMRSRAAMTQASDRVYKKFGFPCSRARATLADIESRAEKYLAEPGAKITVLELRE